MSAWANAADTGRRQWLAGVGALGLVGLSGGLVSCSKPSEVPKLTEAETRFWQQTFPTLPEGNLATQTIGAQFLGDLVSTMRRRIAVIERFLSGKQD